MEKIAIGLFITICAFTLFGGGFLLGVYFTEHEYYATCDKIMRY